MPEIIALDTVYLEDSVAYAELESVIVYPSAEVSEGEEVNAIFYKINDSYQDSNGYLSSPKFLAVTDVDLDSNEIGDDQMSIQYIKFFDEVTNSTMTQFEPTSAVYQPAIPGTESGDFEEIDTYEDVDPEDASGASSLALGGHSWDKLTTVAGGNEDDGYSSDERAALRYKYGYAYNTANTGTYMYGTSAYGVGFGIQNAINLLVAEMASTTMQIEYNFKKSKFPTLSEKNLSAFETDEADQGIDIEVTMTQTTSKSGTSY